MSSTFPFTVAQEKTFLSAALNSTLLSQFFTGIYTGVFVVTLYIYGVRKNRTQSYYNHAVIGSLVALFVIYWILFGINWHFTNTAFSKEGATRLSIFIANSGTPFSGALQILPDIANIVEFVLADGLLVWRCFHANGGTFRSFRIVLTMVLFGGETALAITVIILDSLVDAKPGFGNVRVDRTIDQIVGALFILIAATSITATFTICKNIYDHTIHNRSARKRVSHVIDIVTQSCGIYTPIVVMQAILSFFNTGNLDDSTLLKILMIDDYLTCVSYASFGLLPTLMVARLATASPGTDNTSTEPTSFVSLPPELKDQFDPERAFSGAASLQLDETHAPGEDVDQDGSVIIEETRDRNSSRRDEENRV